jgi:nitroimidazol reductase NimA-like FMN-containing flavoprotein (pyridoxamine 5'-phosphate oxidase superfamily)
MADTNGDVVVQLAEDEAWDFLRRQHVGRLAFHLADEVHIAPVTYAVTGRRLVFRTAEGSKLLGVTMNKDVAFEVDELGEDRATSVILRGIATHLQGPRAELADRLGLHSWVPTEKYEVVAVDVTEISGRSFRLERA